MYRPKLNPSNNIRQKMRVFENDLSENRENFDHQRKRLSASSDVINKLESRLFHDMMPPINAGSTNAMTDSEGLILPKKLINPCLESSDRQNLHRELLFNQKVGKNVLNQKTELQRALEKQKERQILAQQNLVKQQQPELVNGELERVIMQRAQRLEQKAAQNQQNEINNHSINPEYLNARAKLRHTIDTK